MEVIEYLCKCPFCRVVSKVIMPLYVCHEKRYVSFICANCEEYVEECKPSQVLTPYKGVDKDHKA